MADGYWACISVATPTMTIAGSKGDPYTVEKDPVTGAFSKCSCPAFKYSNQDERFRTCKHLAQAEFLYCGWGVPWANDVQAVVSQAAPDGKEYHYCPRCSKQAVWMEGPQS